MASFNKVLLLSCVASQQTLAVRIWRGAKQTPPVKLHELSAEIQIETHENAGESGHTMTVLKPTGQLLIDARNAARAVKGLQVSGDLLFFQKMQEVHSLFDPDFERGIVSTWTVPFEEDFYDHGDDGFELNEGRPAMGEDRNKELSNWYIENYTDGMDFKKQLVVNGEEYNCMEQFLFVEQMRYFRDHVDTNQTKTTDFNDAIARIRAAVYPGDQAVAKKGLHGEFGGNGMAQWSRVQNGVLVRGLYAKFSQNVGLRLFLLNTAERLIIEGSSEDIFYGIGHDASENHKANPKAALIMTEWEGRNLMGRALMIVRWMLQRDENIDFTNVLSCGDYELIESVMVDALNAGDLESRLESTAEGAKQLVMQSIGDLLD